MGAAPFLFQSKSNGGRIIVNVGLKTVSMLLMLERCFVFDCRHRRKSRQTAEVRFLLSPIMMDILL